MWQLYRVRRTSTFVVELEDVSQEKVLRAAAELWLELMQSLTSSFLGSVPLNPIRYLAKVSDVGTTFRLWFRLTVRGWGSLPGSAYNIYIRVAGTEQKNGAACECRLQ